MKFFACTALLLALTLTAENLAAQTLDDKVNSLLSQMTLQEKIGQMVQYSPYKEIEKKVQKEETEGKVGSILNVFGAKEVNAYQKAAMESRLHIPLLFGLDVIHGYKTIFPIPLAEDCAWNPDLLQKCASVGAHEAAAAGIRWTFAPMVDVSREPRWGRISEGSGEDPTLGSILAAARVKGFQGDSLSDPGSVAACAKHFVGYGAVEAGREYNTTNISDIDLWNVHLPPFQAALKAGVRTFMSAFNDLNGIPASANQYTLQEILRKKWGFQGFVVSDWASIHQLIDHGYAADDKQATLEGVKAGVDMDMESHDYSLYIPQLIKEGQLSMVQIDDAAKRILKVKYELGLFENPYTDEEKETASMLTMENRALAQEEARQSIVLLKNTKNLLPLSKNVRTIAVIGRLAVSQRDPLGSWACRGDQALDKVITVLDGIKAAVSKDTQVLYDPGVEIEKDSPQSIIDSSVATAKKADVVIVVAGETQDMSGEAASRTSISLPGRQEELVEALQASGIPVVLVLMNGRPLTIPWETDHLPAIVESWFLGTQHGAALADVLFGNANPSGKLVVTFPRSLGQIPIYYAHQNTGRPAGTEKWTSKYIDSPNTPLFPFGYGLSYTSFTYSGLKMDAKTLTSDHPLKVSATIQNSGTIAGTEIVQLYIHQKTASLTQPVRKLVDFKRVFLKSGESQKVEFILSADQLAFYDGQGQTHLEPGPFDLWVAKDSADAALKGQFELAVP